MVVEFSSISPSSFNRFDGEDEESSVLIIIYFLPCAFCTRLTTRDSSRHWQIIMTSNDDGEAVCYLCLDGGVDDAGQPLRRDCACRGSDAGFVHLSCLTNYAASKSKQAKPEFVDPWLECPNCHQFYQNELGIDIATEFVSFVRRQYPDDTQRQVEALHLKLASLIEILDRLKPVQKRVTEVTANVLLSLIDRLKTEVSPLPMRYYKFQCLAYNTHGSIALDEGTEESARRAEVHFENALEVYTGIGDDKGIVNAKRGIANAKSKYEDGYNTEELLKASQEMYELHEVKFGKSDVYTILAGISHALILQKASRGEEAGKLLLKLLATSKQVLGSHHNTTQQIESALKN